MFVFIAVFFICVQTNSGATNKNSNNKDCEKQLFNPKNYLDQLPSLQLPYLDNIPYPYSPEIKPSRVVPTKVINVVTKYVYKNPVCIRISGKKSLCQPKNNENKGGNLQKMEYLVTKEVFVKDQTGRALNSEDEGDGAYNHNSLVLESSENEEFIGKEAKASNSKKKTPGLINKETIKELLIEDRLDQLETILPHYSRRRVYETSTITVTKVRSNNRATATLLVRNCIPPGFDMCPPPKARRRSSKVAREFSNSSDNATIAEKNYFG